MGDALFALLLALDRELSRAGIESEDKDTLKEATQRMLHNRRGTVSVDQGFRVLDAPVAKALKWFLKGPMWDMVPQITNTLTDGTAGDKVVTVAVKATE